jgi:hypothetical protein
MRVATQMGHIAIAVLCSSLMGCLITDKIEFEPEGNFPPSIESMDGADHPLDAFILIDAAEGMVPDPLVLDVVLRDPNVEDDIQIKVFLDNFVRPIHEQTIPSQRAMTMDGETGPPTALRTASLVIPLDPRLRDIGGCHRIEMLASRLFMFGSREPVDRGDLGTAVWWVGTKTPMMSTFDPASCPMRSSVTPAM